MQLKFKQVWKINSKWLRKQLSYDRSEKSNEGSIKDQNQGSIKDQGITESGKKVRQQRSSKVQAFLEKAVMKFL